MPAKILVADDHPIARKGTALFAKMILPNAIIQEAIDAIEVIKLTKSQNFHLHILDYRMPGMDGYVLSKELLKRDPRVKVIILTSYTSTDLAMNLFDLGVKGFLSKNCPLEEFETCIKEVLAGGNHFHAMNDVTNKLTPNHQIPSVQFSVKEIKLATALSSGMTTQQIADNFCLSSKSIETYRSRLFEKARVKNTSELISYLYRIGQLEI